MISIVFNTWTHLPLMEFDTNDWDYDIANDRLYVCKLEDDTELYVFPMSNVAYIHVT